MATNSVSQIPSQVQAVFSQVQSLISETLAKDWKSVAKDAEVLEVSPYHITLSKRLAHFELSSEEEARQVVQMIMSVAPLKNERTVDAFYVENTTDGVFEIEKMVAVGKFYDEVLVVLYLTLRPKA